MSVVVSFSTTSEGEVALRAAIPEMTDPHERLVVAVSGTQGAEESGSVQREIDGLRDRLDVADVHYDVRPVPPGHTVGEHLVALCAEFDARLLVFGLRRRRPEARLDLGDNARRALLDVPCPVLVVKVREDETPV